MDYHYKRGHSNCMGKLKLQLCGGTGLLRFLPSPKNNPHCYIAGVSPATVHPLIG